MATSTNKEVFFDGFLRIFREQQYDVQLKAHDSDTNDPISAHKIILSARSKVLKNILESDEIKSSSSLETVTFTEMKHEELEAFVEFIYSEGSVLSVKGKKHVRSLYRAAAKYEIPHLRDICRDQLKLTLNPSNVLDIFVLAENPLDESLFKTALAYIHKYKYEVSKLLEFKIFVVNHPNLTVEIMKDISSCSCPSYCPRWGG